MSEMSYQLMPPLSEQEYAELKADIAAHGVLVPVELDEAGNVLDGHHRVKAAQELGLTDWPQIVRIGLSDAEKRAHARKLNLARRHLNAAQKRELIKQQLAETPQKSNRQVADELGVDHKTVGDVRGDLVEGGEIPHQPTITGRDGVEQPSRKSYRFVDNSAEGQEAALEAGKAARKARAAQVREQNDQTALQEVVLPPGKHSVIVIDPPWDMQKIERDLHPNQVAFEYPTMDEEQLLEFGKIVNAMAAEDCHMFMWTTQKYLPMSLRLIEHYGFRYVLVMVWHKAGGYQPYGLPQYNCEFVVYARKGSPQFIDTKAFPCCFDGPRREHSRKPANFYELVARVTAGARVDVFSREVHAGFAQFGNEADKFQEAG